MGKKVFYNPDKIGSFAMQFGMTVVSNTGKKIYEKKKKYYYPDKRTKKYGNQRLELLKKNKL
tara:strand:+ start:215 stop:400 length:186 start_codon:yes stop_codon:yes gene_type:complete